MSGSMVSGGVGVPKLTKKKKRTKGTTYSYSSQKIIKEIKELIKKTTSLAASLHRRHTTS